MRILKRNLAFVLALIMALSLTAAATGIEDYSDVNDIAFDEAVDVMTEMGILEGTNGAFNPTKVLNRAEAAKIVAYMLLGKNADNLQGVDTKFDDVAAGHWAAGYIAYCVNEGIIDGVSATEYNPNGELTGTAFAKMLLSAVGYNANKEFTGARWEVEVNAMALKLGIFNGNLDAVMSAGVTREEAALYAFNTLTKIDTVNYSELFGTYYAGKSVLDNEGAMTLNEQLYGYKKSATADEAEDAFGRTGHVWMNKKNKVVTGMYASAPKAVYTTEVKAKTVYADLGLTAKENAAVVINGVDSSAFEITKKGENTIGGNGVLTEVYVTEDNNGDVDVKIIVIHTYLAKVESVNAKKGTVTVDVLSANTNTNKTFGTTEFKKGDLVLVTYAKGESKYEIQSMELAETVEGVIDGRSKDSYVKLDGEKYEYAHKAVASNLNTVAMKSEATLVIDNYGYALDCTEVAETIADIEGYVTVTDTDIDEDRFGTDTGAVVKVKFWANGTSEVLNLVTEKKDLDNNGTKELAYKTVKTVDNKNVIEWKPVADVATALKGNTYGYNMTEDEEIVLKAVTVEVKDDVAVEFKGERTGKIDGATVRLNNNSVVTIVEDEEVEVIENFADVEFKAVKVDVLMVKDGSILKEVYIHGEVGTVAEETTTIFYAGDIEEIDDEHSTVMVYGADGESYEYVINHNEITLTKNTAYEVKLNNAGDEIVEVAQTHGQTKVTAVDEDGEWIKIADAWGCDEWYLEEAVVWNVSDGIAEGEVEKDDIVSFQVDKDDKAIIVTLFIIKDAE